MTTTNSSPIAPQVNSNEVILSRTFDAPSEAVFKAFLDPEAISQWWGPKGYTTIVDKLDARPGGMWRFVQRDTEGNEYAFFGVFHQITAPTRIVQTFEYEGIAGHVLLETITFEERDGKTILIDQSIFQSAEDRDGMVSSGMEWGFNESMDQLAALLAKA